MCYFYTPRLEQTNCCLPPEESRHAVAVLRKKAGDAIILLDGKGRRYAAVITQASPVQCLVEIIKTEEINERHYRLRIALSPPKNMARFEWFLEKATETGIDEIIPLLCERSLRKKINHRRAEKILVASMKQSGRVWLPLCANPASFEELLASGCCNQAWIALAPGEGKADPVKTCMRPGMDTLVLIGPEGGFTSHEIERALRCGFQPVSFGDFRLRSETAALFACQVVHLLNK